MFLRHFTIVDFQKNMVKLYYHVHNTMTIPQYVYTVNCWTCYWTQYAYTMVHCVPVYFKKYLYTSKMVLAYFHFHKTNLNFNLNTTPNKKISWQYHVTMMSSYNTIVHWNITWYWNLSCMILHLWYTIVLLKTPKHYHDTWSKLPCPEKQYHGTFLNFSTIHVLTIHIFISCHLNWASTLFKE